MTTFSKTQTISLTTPPHYPRKFHHLRLRTDLNTTSKRLPPRLSPSPAPKPRSHTRTPTPTSTTAPLLTFAYRPKSCYLCDEQNPGDFSPTTTFLSTCQLCNREFCPIHKSVVGSHEDVCNINHSRYYHEQLERAKVDLTGDHQDGHGHGYRDNDRSQDQDTDVPFSESSSSAEEILSRAGIYPSLGERERTVWRTSPVSDARMKEIEDFRALDAERQGTKGQRPSTLIETKDFIDAGIAV